MREARTVNRPPTRVSDFPAARWWSPRRRPGAARCRPAAAPPHCRCSCPRPRRGLAPQTGPLPVSRIFFTQVCECGGGKSWSAAPLVLSKQEAGPNKVLAQLDRLTCHPPHLQQPHHLGHCTAALHRLEVLPPVGAGGGGGEPHGARVGEAPLRVDGGLRSLSTTDGPRWLKSSRQHDTAQQLRQRRSSTRGQQHSSLHTHAHAHAQETSKPR
jgi:hypothetical protein